MVLLLLRLVLLLLPVLQDLRGLLGLLDLPVHLHLAHQAATPMVEGAVAPQGLQVVVTLASRVPQVVVEVVVVVAILDPHRRHLRLLDLAMGMVFLMTHQSPFAVAMIVCSMLVLQRVAEMSSMLLVTGAPAVQGN
jgi:hypothetical protein